MTTDTLPVTSTDDIQVTHAETILQKSVCLVLSASYFGNYRTVALAPLDIKKNGAEITAKQKKVHTLTQKLVDTSALKKVNKAIESAKSYVGSISAAGHRVFGAGAHLIPKVMVGEAVRRLKEIREDVYKERAAVRVEWAAIVERAKAERGDLFDASHYPDPDSVEHEFDISWKFINFGAPENLLEVDQAVYEEETAKVQAQLALAHQDWLLGMREAALRVMTELKVRLEPGADGKAKSMHPTALRDLNQFITNLPALNLADDSPLVDTVSRVAAIAEGLDVETLKKAPAIRAMLLERAEAACESLDLLVTTGRRAMNLG